MVDTSPSFNPGQLYRRRDLHKQYGGQEQGGISTPANAPFVMLITGDSGKRYGYTDEWTDEGLFWYTGEGQHGDMAMKSGNRAIRDHKEKGKSLCLFEQNKEDKRFLRFLGEMEYVTHSFREAPDEDGRIRKAIVFHLRPTGSIAPDSAVVSAALAGEVSFANAPRGGGFGSVETNRKVERAAIDFVRRHYEQGGWTVVSVEADKVGYDLRCEKEQTHQHVEVKGSQGIDVCFIITAGEVRNAMMDRHHVTCLVAGALSAEPKMFLYPKDQFIADIELEPIAFRARART
jgi:Domain of unknown function (DUF3883)